MRRDPVTLNFQVHFRFEDPEHPTNVMEQLASAIEQHYKQAGFVTERDNWTLLISLECGDIRETARLVLSESTNWRFMNDRL